MTLKGLFAVWRTVGLDPLRFDVSSIGAKTSDVPTILAALGAGDAIKLWFPFAFAAAIVVWVLADSDFRATREMVVCGSGALREREGTLSRCDEPRRVVCGERGVR
jgi:hypothetical protein